MRRSKREMKRSISSEVLFLCVGMGCAACSVFIVRRVVAAEKTERGKGEVYVLGLGRVMEMMTVGR